MKKQMLLVLTVALQLFAADRPVIPEAQMDLGLTQGKTVAEFFKHGLETKSAQVNYKIYEQNTVKKKTNFLD